MIRAFLLFAAVTAHATDLGISLESFDADFYAVSVTASNMVPNTYYELDYTTSLSDPCWEFASGWQAEGDCVTIVVLMPKDENRFFRTRVQD